MAVNEQRNSVNRIYLENFWSTRADHLGAMGAPHRARVGVPGIREGTRLLADNGTQEPEHGGKSDNVSGGATTPAAQRRGVVERVKAGLRLFVMGPNPAHSDEEKREAQERLSKLDRELAIIIANMKHTNERFNR